MDQNSSSVQVFNNPYIVRQIVSELDIRSLFKSHCLSKDFFDASADEYEKRKDLIHLYLLNYEQNTAEEDIQRLSESFRQYTNIWLNIRPINVLVLIGGYRQTIDYRHRKNGLKYLSEFLPKDCVITYLDVGHSVLTSSIRYKSLTNYSTRETNPNNDFQRTSFPCMSCLMIPHIEGIEVKTYQDFRDIPNKGLKSILFFRSNKTKDVAKERTTEELIHQLIKRHQNKVSFGGGSVVAVKSMQKSVPKDDCLRDHLIITFSGHRVSSASTVIKTTNTFAFLPQLLNFKNELTFECNDVLNSVTIAFVFANRYNFSTQFTSAFQAVFPSVGIFGFQSNDKMFGQHFVRKDSLKNKYYRNIDPITESVVVLVNFQYKIKV